MIRGERKIRSPGVAITLDDGYLDVLRNANRKHDVVAVRITDQRERDFENVGMLTLEDAETGQTRLVDTAAGEFRDALRAMTRERVDALDKELRASGIDVVTIDATRSVVEPTRSLSTKPRPWTPRTIRSILLMTEYLMISSAAFPANRLDVGQHQLVASSVTRLSRSALRLSLTVVWPVFSSFIIGSASSRSKSGSTTWTR